MAISVRPLKLPEDYEGIAALLNALWSNPVTAKKLEEDDRKLYETGRTYFDDNGLLAGYDRLRLVAVTDEDRERIVGYVWIWRAPWTEPGQLNLTLTVEEKHRSQGEGQLLLNEAVGWALQRGASRIVAEIWDDDESSLLFAKNRGFVVERHAYQSELKLADTGQAGVMDDTLLLDLEKQGIGFKTLSELPGEQNERKLYEIYKETLADIPGFTGEVPGIDDWRQWYLKVEGYDPECVLIAVDGERFVGVTNVLHHPATNGMYHEYTAVSGAYRGRKIATGLKIKAIRLAASRGAAYIRTDNDSMNEPILRINRSLGYKPLRGLYRVYRELPPAGD